MAQIKDVSGTAFVVAEFRAEENRAVTPLYRDPVVGLFLSDESRHAAGLVEASFPPVKDMVKIRTRYFDDVLEKQLSAQFRQVVILGAGLDTRPSVPVVLRLHGRGGDFEDHGRRRRHASG